MLIRSRNEGSSILHMGTGIPAVGDVTAAAAAAAAAAVADAAAVFVPFTITGGCSGRDCDDISVVALEGTGV